MKPTIAMRRRALVLAAAIAAIAPAVRAGAVPGWLRELRAATAGIPPGPPGEAGGDTRGIIPALRRARGARLQILPYRLDPELLLIGTLEELAADARLDVQPLVELPNGFEQRIAGRTRLVGDALPFGAAAIRVAYEKAAGGVAAVCLELSSGESLARAAARIDELGLPEVRGARPIDDAVRYHEAPGRVFVLTRRGPASSLAYANVERLRAVTHGA